jgi:aryl-alcohol dehydrogenase-like predicted oxidoreductase
LELALRSGINLIDTSTNYTDGRSERLIGEVLARLIDARELKRDEVVVVSKIGYVQGRNYELARYRKQNGAAFPEMVEYAEGLWHCIHPTWLADQLTRSLDRLGLQTLDLLLLHNPEYFLADAAKRGQSTSNARDEFDRRLELAFRHLESEVEKGRIAGYGVSSNTAAGTPDARDSTDLTRMLACAVAAAGADHHFRALQLPLNLLEPAAALGASGGAESALSIARRAGIAVFVNRPLNAIQGSSILRLAAPERPENAQKLELARSNLLALEREFRSTIAPSLELSPGVEADHLFAWGDRILEIEPRVESLVQWEEIESHVIAPELGKVLKALDGALSGELAERFRDFRGRYLRDLETLFFAMRSRAADRTQARLDVIERALAAHLPPELRAEPLSRQALLVLRSLPGVSCVLLGARSPKYVEDALAALRLPKVMDPSAALAAVRDA